MHPLPLPCLSPSVPLPVSACNKSGGTKAAAAGSPRHHRPPHQQQAKAAVSAAARGGRKLRPASSAIAFLQRHPRPQQQAGCRGTAAGVTSTGPRTPSTTVAASATTAEQRTMDGKVIKSNMGRYDETISPHTQFMYCINKTEECFQALNATKKRNKSNLLPKKGSVKRNENSHSQNTPTPESYNVLKKDGGRPVAPGNHYRSLKLQKVGLKSITTLQGDQNYAGFSEPPSPSVLPKPPSHWVGVHADYPEDGNREIMTVHLKTLLKVNA
ncbi:proline-rich nuclear receptor coactivator 1 [Rhinoraja longicauda]